jgi:hypothetical protein
VNSEPGNTHVPNECSHEIERARIGRRVAEFSREPEAPANRMHRSGVITALRVAGWSYSAIGLVQVGI